MTSIVFNIGFSSEYVIKALTYRGVQGVNKVLLVTALAKDELSKKRNEDAINAILNYLNVVGIKNVKVLSVDVDTTFNKILLQLSEELGKIDDDIEFYLIGGMRILLLSLYYIAQILCKIKKVKVIAFDESMRTSYELLLSIPKIPTTPSQMELLKALSRRQSVAEISKNLNKSESTIIKQIESLGELIDCEKSGKTRECETAILGKVILNLIRGD
ncbi:CRISPR-associated CARF protein Csa3 [Saccharolobus islandicus]|uniref:CRISPR-associated protein, Csx1 n=2 Tax=Saccharolobus islandicus TaxID=43080 RepID=M9UD04_SACIS|nr:CRISPR-associated CARF protein Csa3 [Sulfolobus islandicus]ADX82115.1 CRISPR-associated, Csa3, DNA-binding protein [Sulfolobus islandicus HVE10/4]AGJ62075.1 CRISPR-associated protein, Csx1 [Sulfolobus islandicus LAL14/1]WCM36547.1 CRISPR locus-related DNA-binding protein [Sulfolobus islandicus]